MDLNALSPLIFLSEVIFALILVGILVALGYLMAREKRGFIGMASTGRTCLEVAVLNLLILVPIGVLNSYLVVDLVPQSLTLPAGAVITLLFAADLVIPPLWAAIRLAIPKEITTYARTYWLATVWLVFTFFTTAAFSYLVLPYIVLHILLPAGRVQFIWTLLPFAASFSLTFLILFLFLRGMIDLIRFGLHRRYVPKRHQNVIGPQYDRRYTVPLFLVITALLLWTIASFLYSHRQDRPALTCIPPIYQQSVIMTNIKTPLDRSIGELFASAFTPFLLLLLGLFLAPRRVPAQAALLYVFLCFQYGIYWLDIYPNWGCLVFWSVRLVAWLFIAPVQIHFALTFPYEDETIQEEQIPAWKWVKQTLYGIFILFTPLWLFFHLRPIQDSLALVQQEGWLLPLFALWGMVGQLAFIFSWLAVVYILWQTTRELGKSYNDLAKVLSTECQWLDIVSGQSEDITKIDSGQKQLRIIGRGALSALLLLILWYLALFPIIMPNVDNWGIWSDVIFQCSILIIFLTVLAAIYRFRLWNISRVLVHVFILSVLTFIALVSFQLVWSKIEDFIIGWAGLLAFIVLAYFSLSEIVRVSVYRLVWRGHFDWQQRLKGLEARLRDPANGPPSIKLAVKILSEACPKEATANWLLVPIASQIAVYSIHDINHSSDCKGQCREMLLNKLSIAEDSRRMELPSDLHKHIIEAIQGERHETLWQIFYQLLFDHHQVLVVEKLSRENVFWRFLTGRWKRGSILDRTTLIRLQSAKTALLVPFGGGNTLLGILVIATDYHGDYYDRYDLSSLSSFADQMSTWLATRKQSSGREIGS